MQKWAGIIILVVALGWLALVEASAAFLAQEKQTIQISQEGRASVAAPTMNIVYVNASVSGGAQNGSSWANAYPTLQDALSDTTGVDEIWVAAGVYYPDEGAMQIANSVTATFQLTNSVEIYGGFAATETQRTQRDFLANITVLSGDIDHDNGNADNNKDANDIIPATSDIVGNNANHVVTGSDTNSTAVLDGFTINAGQANGALSNPCSDQCGGGIYNNSGNPTLTNLTITANSAGNNGGGMFNNSSNPTLTNLIIKANSASSSGGGMFNRSSSNPMLTNLTITANSAGNNGGGMFNTFSSNPQLTNVTITANSAGNNGGGMFNNNSSDPTLTNVIIWNNQDQNGTTSASASISNNNSNPSISHSLIANSGGSGAGWQGGLGIDGGNNIADDPMFVQDGDPRTTPPTDGDYRLQAGSSAIDVGDNAADLDGPSSGTQTIADIATDLAGNSRTISIVVDMGAYEADAPQIEVLGASLSITDGVTTTSIANNTDFGSVLVGEGMTHTFTISNTGSTPLTLSLPITLSNSTNFAITTLPATTIPVSSSTSFDITFTPNSTDTFTSTVQIANNDPDRNPFSFVVGGTGVAPEIEVQGAGMSISSDDTTPSTLDDTEFGEVLVGQGMTHTFTIRNTGSYSLTLDLPIALSDSTHLTITSQPSATIPVGGSSTFSVHFAPTATGIHTTTISITNNDQNENPYTFVVGGTGTVSPPPPPPPPPVNQPPQLDQPIPDITVVEGAADQILNPFDYFSDPEGDRIFFSVLGNSNPAVLPNLIEGVELGNIDQMPLQFGVPGQTQIRIQARELRSNATIEDTFIVTVLQRPTISISKRASESTVSAGLQISYTITISNSGPSTLTQALIRDPLPAGVSFVAGSISAVGVYTGTVGSQPPILASAVTLAPTQTMQLEYTVTVNNNLLANQAITNTVQLTATELISPLLASHLITTIAPTLTISDVTVSEGSTRVPAANATFVVSLSQASALPVTVEYTTVNGSATADADYTPISGTLTIPAGDITSIISVPISDDELVESDETFILRLSNATNATLADAEGMGTILDDDQEVTSVTLASFSALPEPTEGHAGSGWWIGAFFALLALCGWSVRRTRGKK